MRDGVAASPAPSLRPGTDRLRYTTSWLERYESATGADAVIVGSEMAAVQAWFDHVFAGGRRWIRHLDVGTCTGRYMRWGIRHGFDLVCGIDASADATAFCAPLRRPGRVCVHQADVLCRPALDELLAHHGRFDLVTMMMGTINHVERHRQGGVIDSLAGLLAPHGRLLVSSWRPGRCALSLYGEDERRYLGSNTLASAADAAPTVPVVGQRSTRFHTIVEFAARRGG